MTHQSESQLERTLITQLNTLGFESVSIPDADTLTTNLRSELEKFNNTTFTDAEFAQILNHLHKGDRFQKAKTLRDRFLLKRDTTTPADNATPAKTAAPTTQTPTETYIRFFNTDQWCQNRYQVTHQITQVGAYENRYDVTLLINGLPLVQIELKRRGIEMKEAFNQIQRYQRESFGNTLFDYVQIFIISNGVNTKYFANNPKQPFAQTFFWTDRDNKKIANLHEFTDAFLEKCRLSEFIAEFIVLAQAQQIPMVLRPYQYYATKAIEQRVRETDKNGYIWHTTGSGKTLTSFKTSQILQRIPEIKKVLFVVDRNDLDIQTTKEFNSFSEGSVDGTENARHLIGQLTDTNRKLIVTTLQKFDVILGRKSYLDQIADLADERVVIIFDECHRSQFGQTHARIKEFFTRAQLFGFTGTPIFEENNVAGVTTADVFDEKLHSYTITDAISDQNVLGFSVEYVGKYKQKAPDVLTDDTIETATSEGDPLVPGIDTKELLEHPDRLAKITDFILTDWKHKTKDGKFNALFAVPNIDVLKTYYTLFNQKKPDNFRIATIFTYQANEDAEALDLLDLDTFSDDNEDGADDSLAHHRPSREFLEGCIADYNRDHNTNFSSHRFYDYYKHLQKRIKDKEVDLVLVVNMLLTGFDSKLTNTLYVDKNLRYHGLIQAYSRTNRLYDTTKPHGNIVSFRNLKPDTDKALALFGNKNAKETVFKKPYDQQVTEFNDHVATLREIAPDPASITELRSEDDQAKFIKAFRALLRDKSSLETFAGFTFDDLDIAEQEFYDFQSKYLDLYEERKLTTADTVSVVDDLDFELELTIRDTIDFDYIIKLIAGLKDITSDKAREQKTSEILSHFDRDPQLRKKKDLIRKFIEESLPHIDSSASVEDAFANFWTDERQARVLELAAAENIQPHRIQELFKEFNYTQRFPREQEIVDLLNETPDIFERENIVSRIKSSIKNIAEIFDW